MPEIVLPGLREVGSGPSEFSHKTLEGMRQSNQIQMWSAQGTAQECEDSWLEFCLRDTPAGWVVYS